MPSRFVEELVLWFTQSNPGIDVSPGSAARHIIEVSAVLFEQRSTPMLDPTFGMVDDLATMHGIHVNIAPFIPLQEIALTLRFVDHNAWCMIDADVDA